MKPGLILIGSGGHCKSCIDVIEQEGTYKIAGIIDKAEHVGKNVLGYDIIGTDDDLPELKKQFSHFFITIGQIKTARIRIAISESLNDVNLPVIVSPLAYVSKHACIKSGTIVMHNALVNAGAVVGENCILNSNSLIEHDTCIRNHCHISTGATVNGGVEIGSGTFFGSNAVVKEYVIIGENCVIGAGVTVLKDIKSESFYVN
jgi:sugar O-acyltransferase (sialic acid O-acetyltransferase NeuD family)